MSHFKQIISNYSQVLPPSPPPGTLSPTPPSPLGSSCQVVLSSLPLLPPGSEESGGGQGDLHGALLLLLPPPVPPLVGQDFIPAVAPLKNCPKVDHPSILQ